MLEVDSHSNSKVSVWIIFNPPRHCYPSHSSTSSSSSSRRRRMHLHVHGRWNAIVSSCMKNPDASCACIGIKRKWEKEKRIARFRLVWKLALACTPCLVVCWRLRSQISHPDRAPQRQHYRKNTRWMMPSGMRNTTVLQKSSTNYPVLIVTLTGAV